MPTILTDRPGPGRVLALLSGKSVLVLAAVVAAITMPATSARCDIVTILGDHDANFTDPVGNGTYTTLDTNPTGGLDIRDFIGAAPNFDHRSVVHFSLPTASLPADAVVTDVAFNFQAESVTGNTGRTVGLLGYTAASSLTLADATAAAALLGTYDNFALGTGKHSIDLGSGGVTLLNTLVSTGKTLDLRIQGTTYGTNTLVDSIEMANSLPQFYTSPSITVTFTRATAVPEPSVLALAGTAALIGFVGRMRRSRAA